MSVLTIVVVLAMDGIVRKYVFFAFLFNEPISEFYIDYYLIPPVANISTVVACVLMAVGVMYGTGYRLSRPMEQVASR